MARTATSANHASLMRHIELSMVARSQSLRADEYHACQRPIGKLTLKPMAARIPAMPVTIASRKLTTH